VQWGVPRDEEVVKHVLQESVQEREPARLPPNGGNMFLIWMLDASAAAILIWDASAAASTARAWTWTTTQRSWLWGMASLWGGAALW
jgi:hypothetical protein